mmetsp:Transcript_10867/g.20687  ORF Transcript_10867/g.20687 Transcript_10867/m.20687 type:complete len:88 (+) Transcript_10867:129-392(+)
MGCGVFFTLALVRPSPLQSQLGGDARDARSGALDCYSWGVGYSGALAQGHTTMCPNPRKVCTLPDNQVVHGIACGVDNSALLCSSCL